MSEENSMSNFKFVGDFDFKGQDAWLQFRIPMKALRDLVAGPSGRQLVITREETISLLRAIYINPDTSQSYKQIVSSLLKRA